MAADGMRTSVELAQVVGCRLLVNCQAAELHDVAAHVVGVVVAGALLDHLVLLLQRLLSQVCALAVLACTVISK